MSSPDGIAKKLFGDSRSHALVKHLIFTSVWPVALPWQSVQSQFSSFVFNVSTYVNFEIMVITILNGEIDVMSHETE